MDQKIFLDYMNARLDDMLRDTDRLMRFESLLEKPEETEAALDCVLKLAQDMGMRTGKTPRGDAGYAEIGDGSETVAQGGNGRPNGRRPCGPPDGPGDAPNPSRPTSASGPRPPRPSRADPRS